MYSPHSHNNYSQQVSPFVIRLYDLLNDQQSNGVIQFDKTKKSLVILKEDVLKEILLPRYFPNSKMESFVRQLNGYDFHKKVVDGVTSFQHDTFDPSNENSLQEVKRKKPKNKRVVKEKKPGLIKTHPKQQIESIYEIPCEIQQEGIENNNNEIDSFKTKILSCLAPSNNKIEDNESDSSSELTNTVKGLVQEIKSLQTSFDQLKDSQTSINKEVGLISKTVIPLVTNYSIYDNSYPAFPNTDMCENSNQQRNEKEMNTKHTNKMEEEKDNDEEVRMMNSMDKLISRITNRVVIGTAEEVVQEENKENMPTNVKENVSESKY
ncbi:Heat stress transcription factor A-6B [Entamoeba marina]